MMPLTEAISNLSALLENHGSLMLVILLFSMSFVEVSKIKINPWTFIFSGIGKLTTKEVSEQLNTLTNQIQEGNARHIEENEKLVNTINEIKSDLDTHIQESVEKDMRDRRIAILDYANAIVNGRNHLKEEYEYVIGECDQYELDCDRKGIKNSVAEESIKIIKKSYADKLKNNSFL